MLTLAQATTIVDTALSVARQMKLQRLAVIVVDPAGYPIAMKREDEAPFMRTLLAQGKAWGCVAMGMSSRAIETRATARPHFFQAVSSLGPVVPVAGGVLIRDAEGQPIGAVGISGDTSDNDEACAIAAIEAAGLVPDARA